MIDATHAVNGTEQDVRDDDLVIRAKWTLDGAVTLAEAAEKAREFAGYLDGLREQGYVLRGLVEDDYGFACKAADL